jgi:error-prone DNA polymerase
MGFYAPSTIVGDAQRHALEVRPIDVAHSDWDCTLEPGRADAHGFAVRMGLRWVKGMTLAEGERIVAERRTRPFASLDDFVRRSRVSVRSHGALAEAGALASFTTDAAHRRDALWQVLGWAKRERDQIPLGGAVDDDVELSALGKLDEIIWDYRTSYHSTRGHPLAPLRDELRARGWPDARSIASAGNDRDGRPVDYVGIVICRQQPGTASGVTFMTLEDETGFVNLVVWAKTFAEHAPIVRGASLLGVSGKLQVQDRVVHVIADRLWIPELSRPVAPVDSRDFH